LDSSSLVCDELASENLRCETLLTQRKKKASRDLDEFWLVDWDWL